ncbi:hypothetical protein PR202_gb06152 [Eleusine coracana subsp. coracana]|uniref:DUF3615 domain-containing protein n=1 Tax=Eleusine coracana subsp. coracana TaxID=191504 RepID=A0AAV5E764_ELECO|nr:hypothetical protein PR202_gb06152 [Eleusine coracana subsp. coracana]
MHYNTEEKNKVEYKLVRAVTSCGIVDDRGVRGHVNFIAKGDQENSEEELFFAELCADGYMAYATNCVISLKGVESVGRLRGMRYDYFDFSVKGLRIDAKHCYACSPRVKHPKNGLLYESGHVACSDYYFG